MAKDCPSCGLVNPPHAQWCDCGYQFASGRVGASPLNERDRATNAEHAEARRPVIPVPGGCLGVILASLILEGSNGLGRVVGGASLLFTVLLNAAIGLGVGGFLGAWGGFAVALDFGIRKFLYRGPLLDVHTGSRFVFLPGWLFGTFLFLFGTAMLLAERIM